MIYNTRNRSNVKNQSNQSKVTGLNKMWSLRNLAMLKCESKTSLHPVQHK